MAWVAPVVASAGLNILGGLFGSRSAKRSAKRAEKQRRKQDALANVLSIVSGRGPVGFSSVIPEPSYGIGDVIQSVANAPLQAYAMKTADEQRVAQNELEMKKLAAMQAGSEPERLSAGLKLMDYVRGPSSEERAKILADVEESKSRAAYYAAQADPMYRIVDNLGSEGYLKATGALIDAGYTPKPLSLHPEIAAAIPGAANTLRMNDAADYLTRLQQQQQMQERLYAYKENFGLDALQQMIDEIREKREGGSTSGSKNKKGTPRPVSGVNTNFNSTRSP